MWPHLAATARVVVMMLVHTTLLNSTPIWGCRLQLLRRSLWQLLQHPCLLLQMLRINLRFCKQTPTAMCNVT